jgi:hypothetical protein
LKSHFSQIKISAFFGVKLSVICQYNILTQKTPKLFSKIYKKVVITNYLIKKRNLEHFGDKSLLKEKVQEPFEISENGHL